MLQTSFDTPPAVQAILSRAALAADSFDAPTFSVYDLPAGNGRIGGLTIADIDEAAREVSGLLACDFNLWKFF